MSIFEEVSPDLLIGEGLESLCNFYPVFIDGLDGLVFSCINLDLVGMLSERELAVMTFDGLFISRLHIELAY